MPKANTKSGNSQKSTKASPQVKVKSATNSLNHSLSSPFRKRWDFGYFPEIEKVNELAGYGFYLGDQSMRTPVSRTPNGKTRISKRRNVLLNMQLNADIPKESQSNFSVLRFLYTSLQYGILPPPWVADRFLEVINDRYQNKIKSLDEAFGFTSKGKGKRIPKTHQFLLEERDHWLGRSVLAFVILGETVEQACGRVAKFFMGKNQETWNKATFDLEIINLLKRIRECSKTSPSFTPHKPDGNNSKTQLEERIRQLYFKWKKENPKFANDPEYKELVRKRHKYFERLFPL